MNNATINRGVQISLGDPFNSVGYIPRIGIAGSHGNSIFNFLRNCHIIGSKNHHDFELLLNTITNCDIYLQLNVK